MKKTFLIWIILAVLCSACGVEENTGTDDQDTSFQVTDYISLSENDITVSEGTISEERTSFDTASEEESGTGENLVTDDTENDYNWYAEPDPQATFMLRVEGNISENQAWVDFLKGEVPDYTGIDFTSGRYAGVRRPYTLQDMEGYFVDPWSYGASDLLAVNDGQLTSIQIFPYNIDTDEEEELLFICNSYAGTVQLWVLNEIYENVWCLYPSNSNKTPFGILGRIWLWSNGIVCFQEPDNQIKYCPELIQFYRIGEGLVFSLDCSMSQDSDLMVFYYCTAGENSAALPVMFDRNGEVIDGTLVYPENVVCIDSVDERCLEIITRAYEGNVGDAVPVRELTGLEGTEDGVIIVTREEFYSGAYLE